LLAVTAQSGNPLERPDLIEYLTKLLGDADVFIGDFVGAVSTSRDGRVR
jgi:hypothetical protein